MMRFRIEKLCVMLLHSVMQISSDASVELTSAIADINMPHIETQKKALPREFDRAQNFWLPSTDSNRGPDG